MWNSLIINSKDNVIVAIEPIKKGEKAVYCINGKEESVTAREDINIYHKIACCDISEGSPVIKYGERIGTATRDIKTGEHVHVHNIVGGVKKVEMIRNSA